MMLKTVGKFVHHVVPEVARPLHVLWNQIIGFFFLCLACIPIPSLIKELRGGDPSPRLILTIPFVLFMAGFGIASFWKARRVSRTPMTRSR